MYIWIALATIAVSMGLAMLAIPIVRQLAIRTGLVASPAKDRFGATPTPLGGGVAIVLAILMPSILAMAVAAVWAVEGAPDWLPGSVAIHIAGAASRAPMALTILAGAAILCVLGLIDDRRGLGPWLKLVVQIAVAGGVVMAADLRILTMLGEPWTTMVSVLWMLIIMNAMNFLDNMDGLAAGVTLVVSIALLAAAATIGQLFVAGWLCLLIGATAGFLVFNFYPARIYMGDAGSLVLGFLLAVLSMLTTYYDPTSPGMHRMYGVLVPLILLAVPLYDFTSVMFIRIREGRHPMVGDTCHFSHRLVARGMSVPAAVLTIYLCTAVTGISAILLPHVPDWAAMLLAGQCLGVLGVIALLESAGGGS